MSRARLAQGEAAARHRVWLRWAVVLLGLGGAVWLGFRLSSVLNPFLVGLLLAYVLNPVVERLERLGLSRGTAVTALFALVLLASGSALTYATWQVARHVRELHAELVGERVLDPDDPGDRPLVEAFRRRAALLVAGGAPEPTSLVLDLPGRPRVGREGEHLFLDREAPHGERRVGVVERVGAQVGAALGERTLDPTELARLARGLQGHAAMLSELGVQVTHGLKESLLGVSTFLSYLLLVPLYTFFLLGSFRELRDGLRDHLPGAYRERIVDIALKINAQIAAFFRGKLLLCLLKGLITWVGLWLCGVPFAFVVGLLAGALSIVPLVGPLVAGALSVFLAYGVGEPLGLRIGGVLATFALAEAIEGVLQPVVLGRQVGMSPLLLLLSLFVMGELFGFFGVLLAVPLTCVFKTLFDELFLPELRALAAERPAGPEPPHDAGAPAVPSFQRATPGL